MQEVYASFKILGGAPGLPMTIDGQSQTQYSVSRVPAAMALPFSSTRDIVVPHQRLGDSVGDGPGPNLRDLSFAISL